MDVLQWYYESYDLLEDLEDQVSILIVMDVLQWFIELIEVELDEDESQSLL